MSSNDDSEKLNADNFVLDLYRNKTFNEAFVAGLKAACIVLALVRRYLFRG